MKSRSVIRITSLLMAGAMLSGSLFADDQKYKAEASKMLKEVQLRAGQLTRDASTLETYRRSGLSRTSHLIQLTLVKDHVNAIGEQLEMLQAIREDSAPWQRAAIDAIVPHAVKVAAHTEAAIVHFNESPKPLWHADYTGHLQAISDHSDRVKDAVDLHLTMASTQDKLDRLRDLANNIN